MQRSRNDSRLVQQLRSLLPHDAGQAICMARDQDVHELMLLSVHTCICIWDP